MILATVARSSYGRVPYECYRRRYSGCSTGTGTRTAVPVRYMYGEGLLDYYRY
eukprot:COSAG01_NODE_1015_length_12114_cov_214.545651_3_plen_53_part_00